MMTLHQRGHAPRLELDSAGQPSLVISHLPGEDTPGLLSLLRRAQRELIRLMGGG